MIIDTLPSPVALLPAGLVALAGFVLLYLIQRVVTPWYVKSYPSLSVADKRDWDTRYGTMIYSVYIVYQAVQQLWVSDFFWKVGMARSGWGMGIMRHGTGDRGRGHSMARGMGGLRHGHEI